MSKWLVRLSHPINHVLRKVGVEVRGYSPVVAAQSVQARRTRWLSALGVTVVVDVGANTGQYAIDLRRGGYAGRVESFEPLASAFSRLRFVSRNDRKWECHPYALGAIEEERDINISGNSFSSSFLPMLASHYNAHPQSRYVGTETVRVKRLDGIAGHMISDDDVVWLKADTQGFEFQVLQGCGAMIGRFVAVEIELSLVELYSGQKLVWDMVSWLADRGYTLKAVAEECVDPRDGSLLQINGIFLRNV